MRTEHISTPVIFRKETQCIEIVIGFFLFLRGVGQYIPLHSSVEAMLLWFFPRDTIVFLIWIFIFCCVILWLDSLLL